MIVRINQVDHASAEALTGWSVGGLAGEIAFPAHVDVRAFQVLILEEDERAQPLTAEFRRRQMRTLIPKVLESFVGDDESIVLRLDGPFTDQELLPALSYATDSLHCARYVLGSVEKFDPAAHPPLASLRLQAEGSCLTSLCGDPRLGLERSVRLRAMVVPEVYVDPLLDSHETEDERFREILPVAKLLLSTARDLASLFLWTGHLESAELKQAIIHRLSLP